MLANLRARGPFDFVDFELPHGFPTVFLVRSNENLNPESKYDSPSWWATAADAEIKFFSAGRLTFNICFAIILLSLATRRAEDTCRRLRPMPKLTLTSLFAIVGLAGLLVVLSMHARVGVASIPDAETIVIDFPVSCGVLVIICIAWLGLADIVSALLARRKAEE